MEQHGFVATQLGLDNESIERREKNLRGCGGLFPGKPVRDAETGLVMCHDPLRLRAPAHDAHHAVSNAQVVDSGTAVLHFPGILEPRNVGGRSGRSRVASPTLQQIRAVERGRVDANTDLFRAHGRGAHLSDLEHVRTSVLADDHRLHGTENATPPVQMSGIVR